MQPIELQTKSKESVRVTLAHHTGTTRSHRPRRQRSVNDTAQSFTPTVHDGLLVSKIYDAVWNIVTGKLEMWSRELTTSHRRGMSSSNRPAEMAARMDC